MTKMGRGRLLILLTLALLGLSGGVRAWVSAFVPPQTMAIHGRVSFSGEDSDRRIRMNADPVCVSAHQDPVFTQQIVAREGGLANVFVWIKQAAPKPGGVISDPGVLHQEGCIFRPHVLGVQVGQPLLIRNEDPTGHNIHALAQANKEFNMGQPFQGLETMQVFKKSEVMVRIKCDIHPWMSAYIGVLDHPFFAVTGETGAFSIEGLAAGTYQLEAWHELLGRRTIGVDVASGSAPVEIRFD